MVSLAFANHQMVPNVVSSPPTKLLDVKYSKSGKTVNLGNEIAPIDVRDKPDITYDGDSDGYYSLVFTDPDVPYRENPVLRGFRHWLVVNIPGSDVSKGQDLNAYIGSCPSLGSGLHRYTFLLYKQPKKLKFKEKVLADNEIGDRLSFSPDKFSKKYKLELMAGNFFQAMYDDSVPALHENLGRVLQIHHWDFGMAFTKNQLVPDVVSSAPTKLLDVKYPKSGKTVNLGNEITPTDVREKPDIKYVGDSDSYYSLVFTDPDVPSRENPTGRGFRHWLVVNIPGSDVSKGQDLNAYIGSGPSLGSGLHRYTFLLYKQPKKLDFKEKPLADNEIGDRPSFSPDKFSEEYKLELIAGNFYQAQYDDSVPALYKYLGM